MLATMQMESIVAAPTIQICPAYDLGAGDLHRYLADIIGRRVPLVPWGQGSGFDINTRRMRGKERREGTQSNA